LKTLGFLPRRRELTRAAFRDYYERRHAPLALSHVHVFLKYVRNHLADGTSREADFDALSEFWYDSPEAAAAVGKWLQTPAGQVLRDDEARFMDRARIGACIAEEHHLLGPPRRFEAGPVRKLALLLAGPEPAHRRRPDVVREVAAGMVHRHGAMLQRALLDVPVSPLPEHLAIDGVLWIWPLDEVAASRELGGEPGAMLHTFDAIETAPGRLRS
jgi:hypothetical protein